MTGFVVALQDGIPFAADPTPVGGRAVLTAFIVVGLLAGLAYYLRRGLPVSRLRQVITVETAVSLGDRRSLVVVSVALPTVLAHLVAAVCGVSLSALLARAASGIRVVIGAAWRVLPGAPRAPGVRSRRVIGRVLTGVLRRVGDTAHPDRGPPVLAAA